MTRKFYHGRTETMRPCTREAVDWCKAMIDPACDVSVCMSETLHCGKNHTKERGGSSLCFFDRQHKHFFCQVDAKRKAMLLAFNKHNKLMFEAQEGKG